MDYRDDGRHGQHGEGFGGPIVRLAGGVEVDGQLIGQFVPQNETRHNGQQAQQGGEDNGLFMVFPHGLFSFQFRQPQ